MRDDLIKRYEKARQITVAVDDYTFTARRPNDVEIGRLGKVEGTVGLYEIAREFVDDWGPAFTEADFIKGGASDVLPFERVLWAIWLADRPQLWGPIANGVVEAYREHAKAREDAKKN